MLRRLVMVVGKEQLGPTRLVKSLIFLRLDARSLARSVLFRPSPPRRLFFLGRAVREKPAPW